MKRSKEIQFEVLLVKLSNQLQMDLALEAKKAKIEEQLQKQKSNFEEGLEVARNYGKPKDPNELSNFIVERQEFLEKQYPDLASFFRDEYDAQVALIEGTATVGKPTAAQALNGKISI